MRRARAKKGADAARVSKREQGGAVKTMEGWWERPDRGARWRDDGRERRRGGAHTAAKIRAADHFWAFLWYSRGSTKTFVNGLGGICNRLHVKSLWTTAIVSH